MLVGLHTAVCYSHYVSEKILVCFSNIATNIVESLPGILGKGGGLVHELECALVIICAWRVTEQALYRWCGEY